MKIFTQLALIFSVCFLGKLISGVLPFAFPVSVMGMLLMLILLLFRVIKPKQMKETAEFLLGNMAFFFIPAGVGIIAHFDRLEGKIPALLLVVVLTTLITFAVTAYTIMLTAKLQNRGKQAIK